MVILSFLSFQLVSEKNCYFATTPFFHCTVEALVSRHPREEKKVSELELAAYENGSRKAAVTRSVEDRWPIQYRTGNKKYFPLLIF